MAADAKRPRSQPPADALVFQEAQACDAAQVYQAGRDQHLHLHDGVHETRRTPPAGEVCPYPGLAAFSAAQAEWFFGRDRLIAELTSRAAALVDQGGLLAVVAPSGAGKSSLLRAGLLPALAQGRLPVTGSDRWPQLVFTPTANPTQMLAAQLATLTGDDPAAVRQAMTSRPGTYLDRIRAAIAARLGTPSGPAARVVIVVDQVEELFTLCADARQRQAFIAWLASLAAPGPPAALVMFGLRADFYPQCASYPPLWTALRHNQILVGPMSEAELREAILHPASCAGLELEPGLVELLMRDLGTAGDGSGSQAGSYEAGRLPFLAHALWVTWQQRHGAMLTVAGYQTTGCIEHAIATTAQRVYDSLASADQKLAQILLLRLVNIGPGVEDTRRRTAPDELVAGIGSVDPQRADAVLNVFTQARLLTQDQGTVEISHEALLKAWPRLREWINADRAGHRVHQGLEEAAFAWERTGRRDGSLLYRGGRLEDARTWAATSSASHLSIRVAAFLTASSRQQRRASWLRRGAIAALTALTLVASATAGVAAWQSGVAQHSRHEALQQRDTAVANSLAAQSQAAAATQPDLAGLLALAGLHMAITPFTVNSAQSALATPIYYAWPLYSHSGQVHALAFSPNGRTLATGSADGTARLWGTSSHQTIATFTGHTGQVLAIAFSPDGRTLATGSADGTARLWDTSSHQTIATFTGHTGQVLAVAFSPDGRTLATGNWDNTARLWDVSSRHLSAILTRHEGEVFAVAFSPNGRTLATGSADGTARLWDTSSRQTVATLTGHSRVVDAVAFSPDGRTLATGSWDNTTRLWNVTNGKPIATLTGHTDNVSAVAFGAAGDMLATASLDGATRLWDMHKHETAGTLSGNTGWVDAVTFSPDRHTLATGSRDGTAHLWGVASHQPIATLAGHHGPVFTVAFSPDGRTLASGSGDGTIRLWDVRTGQTIAVLPSQGGEVASVAFSPTQDILATTSTDGTARLWDVHNHRPIATLTGHTGWVDSVAFSPGGETLATASTDGTARLWDVHTHRTIAILTGHRNFVSVAAFSPAGDTIATASGDGTARLWDVHSHRTIATLTGHRQEVTALAFSPDGRTLATGSRDNTAIIWDVASRREMVTITGHAGWVTAVAFSPDGSLLATTSWDGSTQLIPTPDNWAAELCQRAGRNLTQKEWTFYIPTTPYKRLCHNFPAGQGVASATPDAPHLDFHRPKAMQVD